MADLDFLHCAVMLHDKFPAICSLALHCSIQGIMLPLRRRSERCVCKCEMGSRLVGQQGAGPGQAAVAGRGAARARHRLA